VGGVQQPQLDGAATPTPAVVAALPADPNAAQPAAGSDPNAPQVVQPGDLAAGQTSAGAATALTEPEATGSATRELGEALSLDRLRREFTRGIRMSAALFLVAFAIFAGKRTFDWARRRYG
jgi:hypothetical protein